MSKFKEGDRIAVYGPLMRWESDGFGSCERKTGTVQIPALDGLMRISIEDCKYLVHEKQCRKLRPKKRREWTFLECQFHGDKVLGGYQEPGCVNCKVTHVREYQPTKEGV